MRYLLLYDYIPDILERRAPFRPDHLALVKKHFDAGRISMAGALEDPLDGAAIVFEGESPEIVEAFIREDPYVSAGLVVGWRIRRWALVAGG
jgi:uncharacterized protein YciI